MKKIVVLCVNYNNSKEVLEFIDILRNQNIYSKLDVVIVDNSENEGEFKTLSTLLSQYNNIFLFKTQKNLGYLKGVDFGLKQYLKDNKMPEWIIISNTDIKFTKSNFFEELLNLYPNGYDGIIAPSIYSAKKKYYQNPYKLERYKKKELVLLRLLHTNFIIYIIVNKILNLIKKIRRQNLKKINCREIYAPHGSFIIINKSYFEKGGDLDFGSFLFCEEIFIAEKSRRIGTKIFYDKRLKVIHNEHSTVTFIMKKKLFKYNFQSIDYCINEFFNIT